mmetsp:Transcript_42854/g.92495  ORF Transcript_42854/g.92495 Transcript_42854/m.92495 type:complete len:871 (-) Transcript_42854:90-2702(-)
MAAAESQAPPSQPVDETVGWLKASLDEWISDHERSLRDITKRLEEAAIVKQAFPMSMEVGARSSLQSNLYPHYLSEPVAERRRSMTVGARTSLMSAPDYAVNAPDGRLLNRPPRLSMPQGVLGFAIQKEADKPPPPAPKNSGSDRRLSLRDLPGLVGSTSSSATGIEPSGPLLLAAAVERAKSASKESPDIRLERETERRQREEREAAQQRELKEEELKEEEEEERKRKENEEKDRKVRQNEKEKPKERRRKDRFTEIEFADRESGSFDNKSDSREIDSCEVDVSKLETEGGRGSHRSRSMTRTMRSESDTVLEQARSLRTTLSVSRIDSSLYTDADLLQSRAKMRRQKSYRKDSAEVNRSQGSGLFVLDSERNFLRKCWANLSWKEFRRVIRNITDSAVFHTFSGLLIAISAALVGAETEIQAQKGYVDGIVLDTQMALNCWFVIELIIRIYGEGGRFFHNNPSWKWNWFDLIMTSLSALDIVVDAASYFQLLRILRIARVMRSLRLARWFRQMREFRKMVFSLMVSIQTLVWAVVLLLFVMYIFGICFTSTITEHLIETGLPRSSEHELFVYFGNLPNSMYSLWVSVSGGVNWHYIVQTLWPVNSWLAPLFISYISITVLGVMNVVTSVFVESAMRSTQHYRDLLLQEKERMKETTATHLREIFRAIDVDDSGMITMQELRDFLDDDSLQLQTYMEALEINAEDAKALFKLLDRDNSGEIDIDEFCDGCMRLRGEAKSFDINCLMYHARRAESNMWELQRGLDVLVTMMMNLYESRAIDPDFNGEGSEDADADADAASEADWATAAASDRILLPERVGGHGGGGGGGGKLSSGSRSSTFGIHFSGRDGLRLLSGAAAGPDGRPGIVSV